MTVEQVVVALVAALVSGLLSAALTARYYRRRERRHEKLDTLTRVFGYRFDIVGPDFTRALNEIVIVFHDSKDVLRALQGFHDVIVGGQKALANDKLGSLLKAMCTDSGVDPAGVNDSFYLQPFNINPASAGKLGIDNDGTLGT